MYCRMEAFLLPLPSGSPRFHPPPLGSQHILCKAASAEAQVEAFLHKSCKPLLPAPISIQAVAASLDKIFRFVPDLRIFSPCADMNGRGIARVIVFVADAADL